MYVSSNPPSGSESDEDERRRRNREIQKNWYHKQRKIESEAKADIQRLESLQVTLANEKEYLLQQASIFGAFLKERDCPFHTPPEVLYQNYSNGESGEPSEITTNNLEIEEVSEVSRSSTPSDDSRKEKNRLKSRRFRLKVKLLTQRVHVLSEEVRTLQDRIDHLKADLL
ncbi:hypothetical protein QR680_013611 [Steinernema hermaphroditum]|uniref:BZIP domain-containing protein n=1 Tax=Steinernema hermaphroditum TaxID=289476 RepID=A0AA39I636_9BILA|nr:hypothetical protein QR680_013611 [Steinernema hermaphroditum]